MLVTPQQDEKLIIDYKNFSKQNVIQVENNMELIKELTAELNSIHQETTNIVNEIDTVEANLQEVNSKIDIIEKEKIKELRSQIDAARKTLADKKLVLKERQELLQSREEYLRSLGEPEWQNSTLASFDNIDLSKILEELQQNISNTNLKLTSNSYLDKDSFEVVVANVKNQTVNDELFAKEFVAYLGKILSEEQKMILLDIHPNYSQ